MGASPQEQDAQRIPDLTNTHAVLPSRRLSTKNPQEIAASKAGRRMPRAAEESDDGSAELK